MEFIIIAILIGAFFATRYLIKGSIESKITPIYYVIGIFLAPITIIIAVIKWLFVGKA